LDTAASIWVGVGYPTLFPIALGRHTRALVTGRRALTTFDFDLYAHSAILRHVGLGFTCYHSILASALAREEQEYLAYYDEGCKRWGDQIEDNFTIEERRIVLIFLSASLTEATINAYLSLKLTPEQFNLLERVWKIIL
jgi:hypothetical protein